MKARKRNAFFILTSVSNPDIDFIYQWHTDLCIKVQRTKIISLQSTTSRFIYRMRDKCLYVFEKTGTAIYKLSDIRSAITWYTEYYNLPLTILHIHDG